MSGERTVPEAPPSGEPVPADPGAGPSAAARERPPREGAQAPPRSTRAGRVWIGLGVLTVVLALLIVFIAENSREVKVSFLGASGRLGLGLALLIAAVAGAVIALLAGSTRIVQLRREVRRQRRA
jgi:uncharacterized integral membrane protein